MKREIKFRAWDKVKKKMLDNSEFVVAHFMNKLRVCEAREDYWYDIHNLTPNVKLMQYTGLKDKNGKEIYEGDILGQKNKRWGYVNKYVMELGDYDAYTYEDGCSFVGYIKPDIKDEVIGNIYENPELLSINKQS